MYVCLFSPYYNRGHCNAPGFFRLQERTQIKFLFLLVRNWFFFNSLVWSMFFHATYSLHRPALKSVTLVKGLPGGE